MLPYFGHMRAARTRNNRLPYLALAIVFLVAAASQITYTIDVLRDMAGNYPVRPFAIREPWPTVQSVDESARRAGLQRGDRIVSIDGRAVKGWLDLAEPVRSRRPGDSVVISVLRGGQTAEVRAGILADPARPAWSYALFAWLIMPAFSLVLGFWVVAARPRDPRAWMILGILLGLAHLSRAGDLDPLGWGALLGLPALILRQISAPLWSICMMLFGVSFPARWSVDRKAPWLKWLLLALPSALIVWIVAEAVTQALNYPLAAVIPGGWINDKTAFFALCPCISVFFASISQKYGESENLDDRRRLRLLYGGASVALTPLFLLFLYDLIVRHRSPSEADGLVLTAAMLAIMVFPMTLAYVVVVQRALDVRMVIRQGLQYALARKGVRVLQALLIVGVVTMAATMAGSTDVARPRKIAYVAIGVVLALRISEFGERLRRWVDRKFFRESYNAEQILSDLGEQVRGILERDALLETVARKLSESLHVERVVMMLRDGNVFKPALALGGGAAVDMAVPADAPAIARLRQSRHAVAVSEDGPLPLNTQLILPLASRKELLGFIGLGPKKSEEPYSPSDTSLLQTVAAQTGLALENASLSEAIAHEVAQRELLSREIEIAREVQQRLFPQNLPEVPALEYAGHCRPALGVGGDYYDFLALSSGRLGLAIGDVSGKGIPAALLMASLQASVRGQSQGGGGNVAELMTNVNRLVCEASPENRYATFFFAQFDPATRRLVYSNGGHNAPIVLRGSEVLRLENGGPPVGLFKFSRYQQDEVQLEPGDLLVLYTDGISEAENPAQDEWGEDALIAAARACPAGPPAEAIQRIMRQADDFANGAPQHDDMTLVIARVLS